MASPNRRLRDRSFSPIGRDFLSTSPVPSIASISSVASGTTVVETLRSKKHHAASHVSHRPRRVIGGDSFQLPPEIPSSAIVSQTSSGGEESLDQMKCPICNETMTNLAELNAHLDEYHNDVGQGEKDNMRSKFMKYLSKAKNFTPVQALNQTFAYADISDLGFTMPLAPGISPDTSSFAPSNSGAGFVGPGALGSTSGVTFVGPHNITPAGGNGNARRVTSPAGINGSHSHSVHQKPKLTEESITRAHWQRETGNDHCSEYSCRRLLTSKTGKVNCRSCGKLFCDEHAACQMKLNKRAKWDPAHGIWARVCFSCFESRPGFNDTSGTIEDLSSLFTENRRKTVTKAHLEANLLEKRLAKLIKLLIETSDPSVKDLSMPAITGAGASQMAKGAAGAAATLATGYLKQLRNYRKQPEQSIVAWQDDKDVQDCPYCEQKFTFSLRKHHCRLCGKVVCASPETMCSSRIVLDMEAISEYLSEKMYEDIAVRVRVCKDCRAIVFGRREFSEDVAHKPNFVKVYENMVEFRRGIESLLPRFQKLLGNFDDPSKPPSHELLAEASRVRKKLLYSFQEYDTAAKRIWKMSTPSAQQAKLQSNVHMAAMQVLQLYMLPLRSLPNALKHAQT
ncbi:FYVE zinc finger-domain-containing protein [Lipomyces tetrasporus]